ncbi:hypothetical protein L1987_59982 [Smallanthus sonchifolius]|uniref:Uncharacterized protein n=1 Tax=Smallanthus sonchifolius TaxID=185202 RepID=A0ACB9D7M2_9ASTR|nr:hypothetical protein L1987_59982 [Smallanthus sonchifolius]
MSSLHNLDHDLGFLYDHYNLDLDLRSEIENDQQPNPDAVEPPSPPHETQQRYIIGDKLGEGSFGNVHICTHKDTGDILACKTIEKFPNTSYCVKREIDIMNKLSHPNIVTLKDCYQYDDKYYMVMDLCSGGTLSDQMRVKGRYTETEAACVTREIVEALKVCHQQGVIHHDLKPNNVMFVDKNATSNLKIIDFGLSVRFEPGKRLYDGYGGTSYYQAPELFREADYGPEVDIWSVGVILYELLYGNRPFNVADNCRRGRETQSLGIAISRGVKGFNWKQTLPGISEDAIDLLKKMLHTKPLVRITAEEVLVIRLGLAVIRIGLLTMKLVIVN